MRYLKICFRPTQEMFDLIEDVKKKTSMSTSEVMRTIMSEYIKLVKKHRKSYK